MSSQPYFSRQSQLLLVAGAAAAGTGAVLDGVAATDTDEDSTAVVDFTALGITDSTVAGAGSLEDFFPGGSRQSFLSRFPTLGTADTDMDTATVQATGMAADTLVKALGTAADTQVKATQNRQDPPASVPGEFAEPSNVNFEVLQGESHVTDRSASYFAQIGI